MPAVSVLGVCVERPPADGRPGRRTGHPVPGLLDVLPVRVLPRPRPAPADQLIDALVELLVRLHLAGLFWGDCSLSNTLFRPDAGRLGAYLVDAETAALHPSLSDGQRHYDVSFAAERVGGELFDLQAGGLLPADVDPSRWPPTCPALRGTVDGADPRGAVPARRAALPGGPAGEPAERAGLRRRRAGADHHRGGHPAAGAHPGGRERPAPRPAVHPHRAAGHREPGPPAAQRHGLLPRLPGAEGGPRHPGDGGRTPLALGGLRPGAGHGAGGAVGPARPGRGVPRDPGAPLVPVRAGRQRRRHHRRRPLLRRADPAHRTRHHDPPAPRSATPWHLP